MKLGEDFRSNINLLIKSDFLRRYICYCHLNNLLCSALEPCELSPSFRSLIYTPNSFLEF